MTGVWTPGLMSSGSVTVTVNQPAGQPARIEMCSASPSVRPDRTAELAAEPQRTANVAAVPGTAGDGLISTAGEAALAVTAGLRTSPAPATQAASPAARSLAARSLAARSLAVPRRADCITRTSAPPRGAPEKSCRSALIPYGSGIYGALFKTPFDCEEEKSAGGVVRFAVGTI